MRARIAGPRGFTGRGGGLASYLGAPVEARATSSQVCGLWPGAVGLSVPTVGAPLGHVLPAGHSPTAGGAVCGDPVSWFQAGLITAPSEFVVGLNGYGKSTLVRKQLVGGEAFGIHALVLGDLKPDYTSAVRALGGQVIELGRGRGHLNYLDVSYARRAAGRLQGARREAVLADAHGRRTQLAGALLTILRHAAPADWEEALIDRALRVLDDRHHGTPVNADLLRVITEGPADVQQVAVVGSDAEYQDLIRPLVRSLLAMETSPRMGHGAFCSPTTEHMAMDRPVAFDLSSVPEAENDLAAAFLMGCWSYGFGVVYVAHQLADAGLERRRNWTVVQDELWRPLRVGHGMGERMDALSRLDRSVYGVGQIKVSHSVADLEAAGALGLIERAPMLALGALPPAEMHRLASVVRLSEVERRLLTSWTTPGAWDRRSGRRGAPPGQGNFLIKVGEQDGIPFHVDLSEAELALNDTNRLWEVLRHRGATTATTAGAGVAG